MSTNRTGTFISPRATIGADLRAEDMVTIAELVDGGPAPVVGNDVTLGYGAKIMGRCVVGDGANIGPGVVLIDAEVGPNTVIPYT